LLAGHEAFTKEAALQLIGKRDLKNSKVSFADHEQLYIEPREQEG
jgi:hypothetical protein